MIIPEFLQYGYIFGSTRYWAWIGTIYLIIMTWQDHRKARMVVDDRLNYFMMGSTFSLLSHVNRPLWYFLSLFVIVLVLSYFINKYKILGDGDAHAIGWIFYGCGILGINYFMSFAVIFVLCTLVYYVAKLGVFRYKKPTPFFIVILLSFLVNGVFMGLY